MNVLKAGFAAAALIAAIPASAQLTVHSDFDFNDNLVPAAFTTETGTVTASGGQLEFDGFSLISADTATLYGGTAPATNYIFEFVATPTLLIDAFDIVGGIVNSDASLNSSLFLFRQDFGGGDTYNALESGEQAFASTVMPVQDTEVTLSYVVEDIDGVTATARLYVNGVEEVTATLDDTEATPIDTAGTLVAIGGSLFDTVTNLNGGWDGTVNRARFSTFILGANETFAGDAGNDNLLTIVAGNDPADLDLDGDVDDADFALFFAAFSGPGVPTGNPAADLDGDNDTDDADFGLAFAAFTGPGGGVPAPEPTSLALLGLGGLLIARRRRA